jgi:hypothetical protein
LWSAERLAGEARRQEAQGLQAEARLSWGRAAAKAESVLVHHPHSRWADDALVLHGEGLANSGACAAAMPPLTSAISTVTDDGLRERAAVAAGRCALSQGDPTAAEQLVHPLLTSRDERRRSTAAYLAGQAAFHGGDAALAAKRFAASHLPEAASALLVALSAAGRGREIVAVTDTVARRDGDEGRWTEALEAVARSSGPQVSADVLDHLLLRGRLRVGARARLLLADGDRLRAAQFFDRARARYGAVAGLVPDSTEAARARIHAQSIRLAQARTLEDLDTVAAQLTELATAGLEAGEARATLRQILTIQHPDTNEVGALRNAEMARDSLAAPLLASELFVRFAVAHPTSLFAPKALIAAGQLRPEILDSVDTVLRVRYPGSPYTQAYHGTASPAFQTVEDSLAVAFGLTRPTNAPTGQSDIRVEPPTTGPRGPTLDQPSPRPEDRP